MNYSHCSCYMVGAARMPTGPDVLSHVLEHEVVWLQHEAMGLTANLTCHSVASGGFGDLQLRHLVLRTQALGPRYTFWSHPTRVLCSPKICCGSKGPGSSLGAEIPEQRPEEWPGNTKICGNDIAWHCLSVASGYWVFFQGKKDLGAKADIKS